VEQSAAVPFFALKKHSKRKGAHCREDGKSCPRAWELITKSMGAHDKEHGSSPR